MGQQVLIRCKQVLINMIYSICLDNPIIK